MVAIGKRKNPERLRARQRHLIGMRANYSNKTIKKDSQLYSSHRYLNGLHIYNLLLTLLSTFLHTLLYWLYYPPSYTPCSTGSTTHLRIALDHPQYSVNRQTVRPVVQSIRFPDTIRLSPTKKVHTDRQKQREKNTIKTNIYLTLYLSTSWSEKKQ